MLPLPLNLQIKFAMTSLDLDNNEVSYFQRNELLISGSYLVTIYNRNSKHFKVIILIRKLIRNYNITNNLTNKSLRGSLFLLHFTFLLPSGEISRNYF